MLAKLHNTTSVPTTTNPPRLMLLYRQPLKHCVVVGVPAVPPLQSIGNGTAQ